MVDTDTVLLPVTAVETQGFNAIPDAAAQILGAKLGCSVESGVIVQSNRVAHTRAGGWHRLVTPALFEGPIDGNCRYLLVDDHVGMGGTLANLKGHVEVNGGQVLGMTTLSESRAARRIAIRADTLFVLRERHGQQLENFWQARFGHGLDCLTQIEAEYLCRQPSIERIGEAMAEAAEQARRQDLSTIPEI